jgi:tetratricopeptide (TPR) repeat protein
LHFSSEGRWIRWSVVALAWIIIAWLAALDSLAVRDYVSMLDESSLLPADSLPLARSAPADHADAHTWVRYALAVQEGGPWRVRWTDIDNAPAGREVHWSSGLVHIISSAGRLRSAFTHEPLPRATEGALAWINLPLFIGVVVFFSWWVARRTGTAAGVLIAFGMGGHRWFYDGFSPNYVDHHGLAAAASFGVVLGVLFMGAGWRRAEDDAPSLFPSSLGQAHSAAIVSAVCGGLGLWISAASVAPTIAMVGLAAAIASWWLGPRMRRVDAEFDGDSWRLWGRVGCGVALFGYLVEYAPNHFGMRLEVNHPLYALAWLGGAEIVALLIEWRVDGKRAPTWRSVAALLAMLAPLIAIAIGRGRVFAPIDPAVARVHRGIEEFYSLPALLRALGGQTAWQFVIGFVLTLPIVLVARPKQRDRLLLAFASLVVVPAVVMACWQVRWWLTASGPQLCLLLVAVVSMFATSSIRTRWIAVLVLCIVFVEQFGARIHVTRANVEARAVSPDDALQPMYRDAAVALRASSPAEKVVLLASPDASMAIGYFGRFQTLASLYWENMPGLEAAAAIFSSTSNDSARALMNARGVTHVAVVSTHNFLEDYLELVRPRVGPGELSRTFGYRLLYQHAVPRWLRPIPFRPRFPNPGEQALLFQVVTPEQTEFEAAWNLAVAEAANGNSAGADSTFRHAIALAAPSRAAELYQSAGQSAYQWGDHALAVRLLDVSMSLRPSSDVDANIAWILATSTDERVRDGRAAFERAQRLARQNPDDLTSLDVFAAALAELGRYGDAVTVGQRMLAIAQAKGDSAAAVRAKARLASYSSGRPWRQ